MITKTMQFRRLIFPILLTWVLLLISGCQGVSSGIHIGVWGGSSSSGGVGVGVSLPTWGSGSPPAEVLLPENLPFQVGAVVAENELYYRRFLGVTPRGAFVVQDYYKLQHEPLAQSDPDTELKLTDAYVVLTLQSVTALLPDVSVHDMNAVMASLDIVRVGDIPDVFSYMELNIDGDLILWYSSGNKALATQYQAGLLHGHWQQWYENANLQVEGQYQFGERFGNWVFWDDKGEILHQYNYLKNVHLSDK